MVIFQQASEDNTDILIQYIAPTVGTLYVLCEQNQP